MKRFLLISFFLGTLFSFAQDTTWVQTFSFDSISTRRAIFDFPESLNGKRFEKVLMYYKLKCSPLTPWDQYNCGEWDYLTYTRVFDHTGIYDSTMVRDSLYQINLEKPKSISYLSFPASVFDTYQRTEASMGGQILSFSEVNPGSTLKTSEYPFQRSLHGNRFQVLLTADELTNAGVQVGEIQALALSVNNLGASGDLNFPSIYMKLTSNTELTSFETDGFTEVYRSSRGANGSSAALKVGRNELDFMQAFTWDGVSNVVIEFFYENPMGDGSNLLFDSEDAGTNTALNYTGRNGYLNFDGTASSLSSFSDSYVGGAMTVSFWAKGSGSAGTNTSVLEAYDTLNNRILNIHLPWSDNTLYFDAGVQGGYDRISKAMSINEIDNEWNHWAFVKDQSAGTMTIYKNGTLWHSGTGKNRDVGYLHRLVIGANKNHQNNWKGKLDEVQMYGAALSQATIQEWYRKKPDANHPNWSDLILYHDFDEVNYTVGRSDNKRYLMHSTEGMIRWDEYPQVGHEQVSLRPKMELGQGTSGSSASVLVNMSTPKEPGVLYKYAPVGRHLEISEVQLLVQEGNELTYNPAGDVISQTPFAGTMQLSNGEVSYYEKPVERVNDVEIGRYITPYGIGFDLGADGFSYVYDVTDYHQYLRGAVDLAAHNTQELLDLRFAFIEGIPPRDVHNRQAIWSDFKSYKYADMDQDAVLSAVDVQLADTSSQFKIKTRFTGHGHNGSVNCCEWDPKTHQILINGQSQFNWEIWQYNECGDNPNTGQGGTWPYAREGWCPGDMVKDFDHELTPLVSPGQTVTIDYDIEDVPANDQDQGNGNYIVAMDLISYSAPNFQHDAAIIDVLNPNNYEYYGKYNPTCSYPRVILQNTGEQPLTKCTISCWVNPDRLVNYEWTGNLAFLEKEIVEIPIPDVSWWSGMKGLYTFSAEIIDIEDASIQDEYFNNNKFITRFESPEIVSGEFFVWFTTNNKASENKYTLLKDNGEVVFERTNMTNTTQYRDTFNLDPGCYSIVLEDSDHDGISFWASNQYEGESAGSFRLRYTGGSVFESFPGDFGHYHRFNFSVGLDYLEVEEKNANDDLFVYPNPTTDIVQIDLGGLKGGEAILRVLDLQGRVVLEEAMQMHSSYATSELNLTGKPRGMYLVEVNAGGRIYTKQLLKQ